MCLKYVEELFTFSDGLLCVCKSKHKPVVSLTVWFCAIQYYPYFYDNPLLPCVTPQAECHSLGLMFTGLSLVRWTEISDRILNVVPFCNNVFMTILNVVPFYNDVFMTILRSCVFIIMQ